MTEAEWLTCTETAPMLDFLQGKVSERKLRLLACGCCRRAWHLLTDARSRRAVEVGERLADNQAGIDEIVATANEAHLAWDELEASAESVVFGAIDVLAVAGLETEHMWVPDQQRVVSSLHHAVWCVAHDVGDAAYDDKIGWQGANVAWGKAAEKEERCQTQLVRDTFGNPFRAVVLDSSWLTSDVCTLAEGIYQERAFDRMPILADALQDTGCDNDDILNHCRQPGEHVRGCWAIDLLTGRQ